jgi:hypothetical protein
MVIKLPVIVCFFGAISWFWLAAKLRHLKVRPKPPASRAHLSEEQRQHKLLVGSRIGFAGGCFFLAAGIVFFWLENSN